VRGYPLPALVFGALCIATLVGFLVFPTYPNYDSYYSLLWGREVLDLEQPFFEGFRVPTEHPLAIGVGALLSLAGESGDRLWIALCLASYLALLWGVYTLAAEAFTPVVGALAAVLLFTRFDFAFLAARGYIDIPYMALVLWAMVLEARRPRRGESVLVLLALAGMLRPEAWFMAAAYWLWAAWKTGWPRRVRLAALAALGPAVWLATDWIVTGNPLFSLQYTSGLAEDLGRSRSLSELPSALPDFFSKLIKFPVLVAALLGAVFALWAMPRRAAAPAVLFAASLGTFVLIGAAGASIIERYLVLSSLALLVFAGVALGGWSMLRDGRWRRAWMVTAALVIIAGVTLTATNLSLRRFSKELAFRGDAHASLQDVLRSDAVRAARDCGPITLPNHKQVPETRWILDASAQKVLARADRDGRGARQRRGVQIYSLSRQGLVTQAFSSDSDPASIQVPPKGWKRVATSEFYAAYVRC
jgi:hypothetical protein